MKLQYNQAKEAHNIIDVDVEKFSLILFSLSLTADEARSPNIRKEAKALYRFLVEEQRTAEIINEGS